MRGINDIDTVFTGFRLEHTSGLKRFLLSIISETCIS